MIATCLPINIIDKNVNYIMVKNNTIIKEKYMIKFKQ